MKKQLKKLFIYYYKQTRTNNYKYWLYILIFILYILDISLEYFTMIILIFIHGKELVLIFLVLF